MKGKFFIECAVKQTQPFHFKEPVLGFNEFSCHVWEHKFFEFPFITGNGQTLEQVVAIAVKVLEKQFGKKNIRFQYLYNEDFNGEKMPMIL
jgi:hypothetical protein